MFLLTKVIQIARDIAILAMTLLEWKSIRNYLISDKLKKAKFAINERLSVIFVICKL